MNNPEEFLVTKKEKRKNYMNDSNNLELNIQENEPPL